MGKNSKRWKDFRLQSEAPQWASLEGWDSDRGPTCIVLDGTFVAADLLSFVALLDQGWDELFAQRPLGCDGRYKSPVGP